MTRLFMKKDLEVTWWLNAKDTLVSTAIQKYAPNGKSLLEVGCDDGRLLLKLNKKYACTGIEPDKNAVNTAKKNKLNVFIGKAETFKLKEKFDVILLLDVLEHTKDDSKSLQNSIDHLKPGGIVIITVPALMALWSEHDKVLGHFRRYRRNQLSALLAKNGLEIEFISYWNFLLLPLTFLFQKLGSRNSAKHKRRSFSELVNKHFEKLLEIPLKIENKLIKTGGKLPIGVSLVAVARKKK